MVALEFYIIAITNRKGTGRPKGEVSLCYCGIGTMGREAVEMMLGLVLITEGCFWQD